MCMYANWSHSFLLTVKHTLQKNNGSSFSLCLYIVSCYFLDFGVSVLRRSVGLYGFAILVHLGLGPLPSFLLFIEYSLPNYTIGRNVQGGGYLFASRELRNELCTVLLSSTSFLL